MTNSVKIPIRCETCMYADFSTCHHYCKKDLRMVEPESVCPQWEHGYFYGSKEGAE